jgi:hypothetical protein
MASSPNSSSVLEGITYYCMLAERHVNLNLICGGIRKVPCSFLFFYFWLGTGVWTQGFMLAEPGTLPLVQQLQFLWQKKSSIFLLWLIFWRELLGFELKSLCLLGRHSYCLSPFSFYFEDWDWGLNSGFHICIARHSTTWNIPPVHFLL